MGGISEGMAVGHGFGGPLPRCASTSTTTTADSQAWCFGAVGSCFRMRRRRGTRRSCGFARFSMHRRPASVAEAASLRTRGAHRCRRDVMRLHRSAARRLPRGADDMEGRDRLRRHRVLARPGGEAPRREGPQLGLPVAADFGVAAGPEPEREPQPDAESSPANAHFAPTSVAALSSLHRQRDLPHPLSDSHILAFAHSVRTSHTASQGRAS